MKQIWDKIEEVLCSVKSDKYLHFIIGAGIALLCMHFIHNFAISIPLALGIPTILNLLKESFIDSFFNIKDIYWTIAGAIIITVIMII